jgi:PAS domain S-box-containing protein
VHTPTFTTEPTAEIAALRARVAQLEAELSIRQPLIAGLENAEGTPRGYSPGPAIGMAVLSARSLEPEFLSLAIETILGQSREALYADPGLWLRLIEPRDLPQLRAKLLNPDSASSELVFRLRRGTDLHWVRAHVACMPSGKLLISFEDMTERRQFEESVRDSEARYRTIVETAYEGIVQVDANFRIRFVNGRMAEMMNVDADRMIGREIFEFLPLELRFEAESLMDCRRSGIRQAYQMVVPSRIGGARIFQASTEPLFDEKGQFAGSLGLVSDLTDRARTEEAMQAGQHRFRALAIHSPTGLFQCDTEGRCLFVNQRLAAIAGIPPESRASCDWLRTVHPLDRDEVCRAWQRAVASEGEFNHEFRILHDDGVIRWVWVSAIPRKDEAGQARHYLGNVLDITERKQVEESLRASEQRFRLLSNFSPVGIFLTNQTGGVVYTNPRYQAIAGASARDLLGHGFLNSIHPDDRDEVAKVWASIGVTTHTHNVERRYLHPDGSCRWVHVRSSPLISAEGQLVGRVGTVEDITERRKVEDQLRESEERYRLLAEHSTDMISKHAPDGRYLYVSPACRNLFGYEPEELIGTHPIDYVHPADVEATWQSYAAIPKRPRVGTVAARVRCKNGSYVWIESLAKTLPEDAPYGPGTIIAVTRDITARKQAEDMLHESEKLAAAGRLAARIAHEINNPLAGIRSSFLLIEDAVPRHHPYFSYLSRIEKEIDRIARIVRRMFDLYRPERMGRQPIELDRTIRDVVALLDSIAAAHEVRLNVEATDASGKLRLPDDAIRQVLYNVVVNAIEASPPGGVVGIEARLRSSAIEISVLDGGPGISDELCSQIYEPFFTTKEQTSTGGLGLGLSISRGIIEALQGTLIFERRQPGGTVFRFTIPLNEESGEAVDGG